LKVKIMEGGGDHRDERPMNSGLRKLRKISRRRHRKSKKTKKKSTAEKRKKKRKNKHANPSKTPPLAGGVNKKKDNEAKYWVTSVDLGYLT